MAMNMISQEQPVGSLTPALGDSEGRDFANSHALDHCVHAPHHPAEYEAAKKLDCMARRPVNP